MDRRALLAALAAMGASPALRAASLPRRPSAAFAPGLQLYTLRGLAAKDLARTLDALGEMGCREVEFAGYHGHDPAAVRGMLDRAGLVAPAAHRPEEDFSGDRLDRALEDAAILGHRYLVLAWVPIARHDTADSWRALGERLSRAGERARGAGVTIGYHNHDFELRPVEGHRPLDLLLSSTDRAAVAFELDLYWCVKGGADPLAFFNAHPGRFRMVHVKDMARGPEQRMADPGEGVLDFGRLLPAAASAGVAHWFIEHDNPPDPMAAARKGVALLRSLSAR